MILNVEVRQIFRTRAKIISYVRRFLDNKNFLEVFNFSQEKSLPSFDIASGSSVLSCI